MTARIALLVIASCIAAPFAPAATTWMVDITYSNGLNTIWGVGDYARVDIWASFDDNLYAFAGAAFDVSTTDPFGSWSDFGSDLAGPGHQDGNAAGGNVTAIVSGQVHLPLEGIFADTSNPILAWHGSFTTDDFSCRTVKLTTLTSKYDVYTDETGLSDSFLATLIEGVGGITVGCPTPGAGATFGIAAAFAARRRRGEVSRTEREYAA